MVLPLIFSALGGALGSAGTLGGIGALGGAALGSGLGSFVETGDLEQGILSGLGAFAGGSIFNALGGGLGGAAANSPAVGAGLASSGIPGAAGAAGLPTKAALSTIGSAAAPMNAAAAPGIMGLGKSAMNFAGSGLGTATGIGGMVGSSLAPMDYGGGSDEGDNSMAATGMKAVPMTPATPPTGYRPGIDPEFNYGTGRPPSSQEIIDYRDKGVRPPGMAGGGFISSLERTFGPLEMAEGGIATLAQSMDGGEPAPAPDAGGNEKDVVAEAISAIKGESSNPEIALGKFLAQFGEDALRELVDKVESGETDDTVQRSEGRLSGAGDGMDDLIPANVEGKQDVLLSDGEFVVPADVVSGIGNGSSDAGARELERMMDRVRTARHGTPEQPPQIEKKEVIPA